MPPAGILQTEMDEEQLLELEIQEELDRVNLNNDQYDANDDIEINNNDNDNLPYGHGASGDAQLHDVEGEVRHLCHQDRQNYIYSLSLAPF
jgi:hypothetical protein